MATFAERLRELRNEKKMTMKDLADKLDDLIKAYIYRTIK